MTFSDVLEQIAFADLKRYLKSHENPKLYFLDEYFLQRGCNQLEGKIE